MEHDFWLERWNKKEIGWHKEDFHPKLVVLGPSIFKPGSSIFVPLCGKSKDMIWLAQQGYSVVGSEISKVAIEAFFSDLKLTPQVTKKDNFSCYQNGPFTIFSGDFFELQPSHLKDCESWYDRAALIALPEKMRINYALKLVEIMPAGSKALIISLTYPQGYRNGPPFSVSTDELSKLWPKIANLKHLCSSPTDLLGRQSNHSETAMNNNLVEEHYFELTL